MLAYLTMKKMIVKEKINNFIHEEKGAADIIAVILVVVIAVGVAWLFREQIIKLINELFKDLNYDGLDEKPTSNPSMRIFLW